MVAPNTTVLAPPAWAQKMAAEAYRDISTQVHIVPNNGATNLTAVAAISSQDGSVALKLVNPNDFDVSASVVFSSTSGQDRPTSTDPTMFAPYPTQLTLHPPPPHARRVDPSFSCVVAVSVQPTRRSAWFRHNEIQYYWFQQP